MHAALLMVGSCMDMYTAGMLWISTGGAFLTAARSQVLGGGNPLHAENVISCSWFRDVYITAKGGRDDTCGLRQVRQCPQR